MLESEKNTVSVNEALLAFASEEQLPRTFAQNFVGWYEGVTRHLASIAASNKQTLLVGVSGCQGSGKSTLGRAMARIAADVFGIPAAALSLDDFYLTRAERQRLAATVHPLLATRGVPGTHDLDLLQGTLQALASNEGPVALPGFDKSRDERTNSVQWRQVCAPLGLVFLEGWCVGVPPQPDRLLIEPVNETESEQDASGHWRQAVNRQLKGCLLYTSPSPRD